jgi:hypothetical protein
MTTDTQLNALNQIEQSGSRNFWKKKILEIYRENPEKDFTDWELVLLLGLDEKSYHLVQPRRSDLKREDKIRATGITRAGRDGLPIEAYIFNPEPKPKPKKMKPVGDKVKWGEMMRTAYAYKAQPQAHHLHSMNRAAMDWIMDFSNNLGDV